MFPVRPFYVSDSGMAGLFHRLFPAHSERFATGVEVLLDLAELVLVFLLVFEDFEDHAAGHRVAVPDRLQDPVVDRDRAAFGRDGLG